MLPHCLHSVVHQLSTGSGEEDSSFRFNNWKLCFTVVSRNFCMGVLAVGLKVTWMVFAIAGPEMLTSTLNKVTWMASSIAGPCLLTSKVRLCLSPPWWLTSAVAWQGSSHHLLTFMAMLTVQDEATTCCYLLSEFSFAAWVAILFPGACVATDHRLPPAIWNQGLSLYWIHNGACFAIYGCSSLCWCEGAWTRTNGRPITFLLLGNCILHGVRLAPLTAISISVDGQEALVGSYGWLCDYFLHATASSFCRYLH